MKRRKKCWSIQSGFTYGVLSSFALVGLASGGPLMTDLFSYKTCVNSPPSFSPGCMTDLTVNIGERATFNCQVDPQCLIQYIHWYHESESGVKRLLKTGRNATEPYVHTIDRVLEEDFGRYYCVIKNVVGKSECSANLMVKSGSEKQLKSSFALLATIVLTYSYILLTVMAAGFDAFLQSN